MRDHEDRLKRPQIPWGRYFGLIQLFWRSRTCTALALPAPLVRSTVGPHDPALTTRGTAQATQPSPAARWSRAARTLVQKGRVRSTCLVVTRSKLNGLTGSLYGALLCAGVYNVL